MQVHVVLPHSAGLAEDPELADLLANRASAVLRHDSVVLGEETGHPEAHDHRPLLTQVGQSAVADRVTGTA